uniref:Craniofacial development protein 2 n=1 Tax=Cacopsylla melanoneura TaxID=428564 RepID=A0A8D8RWT4_9HEMI
MKERKLDLLGLSETKWKGTGDKECRDGYHLYWTGGNTARNGVAIIISPYIKDKLEKVTNISDRMMHIKIRIETKKTLDILQCYAPQTGLSMEEKEEFEQLLEDNIVDEYTVIMGDMNAQVGENRHGYEEVLGPHGWGSTNHEGEKLLDVCLRNGLLVTNSWYKKRESHKITRFGWNLAQTQKSVIDYFLVHKNIKRNLLDVKVIPSVALGSDHRLLVATFRFNKFTGNQHQQERKIKVWKLKDLETRLKFQDMIKQSIPIGDVGDLEDEWKTFKEAFIRAAEETCGRTNNKRRWKETPWWNNITKEAVIKKNQSFRNYFKHRTPQNRELYINAKKEANLIVKQEREKWLRNWEKTMLEDVDGNKKLLYGMVKNKRRDKNNNNGPMIDETNNLITEERKIKKLWKEYFDELLNVNVQDGNNNNEGIHTCVNDDEDDDLMWSDVEFAMKFLKTGKSPGNDEISGELLKHAGIVGVHWIYRLFRKIWNKKQIPIEWKDGIIIPLFKKGDRKRCCNYRGITLTSHVSKLYERIIERKIRRVIEPKMKEEQYGFRPGRSTVDLSFALRQLMEKNYEYSNNLWIGFLDMKKAFDSIIRDKVWITLQKMGINQIMVNRIKNMYDGITSKVKTPVGFTEITSRGSDFTITLHHSHQ